MAAAGLWPNRIATDYLDDAVASHGDRVALSAPDPRTGGRARLTYGELAEHSTRIALGLADLGVAKGDVVAFQLPNWWEYVALYFACVRIGAVANPLMPIFRQRELRFMLNFAAAKVAIVPARFRDFDHAAMLREIRPDLPGLAHVFAVGGEGEMSFERHVLDRVKSTSGAAALFAARRPGPDEVTELMYTSGTSGEPKAVMHTANTVLAGAIEYIRDIGLTERDVVLMASPLAHQTGFIYGMLVPVVMKARLVLQDIWSAKAAAELTAEEGATFTMASTPFLADMVGLPEQERPKLATLKTWVCAGAPIPRVLVQRAKSDCGIDVLSCWGMTENGAVTLARRGDPEEKVVATDGRAIRGMEVRVVDEARRPVPPDTVGNLQARGMVTFVGYLKRPELNATDAEGWFDTGDLARMDKDGYIRIVGRSKDVIIRGGENIPVIEIENLLYRHPRIQDVAVVAMPDPRLGERACAFVTSKDGKPLSLAEITAFLGGEGMAKAYWPERVEVIEAMPRTPSGKIQKFRLRETAAKFDRH
ncbi:MAG: AMP-binding protein [Alphaproteobacteria bacterium]|nr:AMP-binding protein [Alphaproteobacteria bacterium]